MALIVYYQDLKWLATVDHTSPKWLFNVAKISFKYRLCVSCGAGNIIHSGEGGLVA